MRIFLLAMALAIVAQGLVLAGQRGGPPPAQTKCPISGRPVNGSSYADVEGFRILTAGPAEAEQVRNNPRDAFAALAGNNEAAEPVVMVCPVMMNPVNSRYPFVQQAGKRIYYCCGPCQRQIRNDFAGAAAYMDRLAEEQRQRSG